ncbi:putative sphingolipid transporter spinster-like protein 1 [Diplonema papillatum]|nr:putative sphingolipid transporter spinster-like protein 1 [Diplonema papillatum]
MQLTASVNAPFGRCESARERSIEPFEPPMKSYQSWRLSNSSSVKKQPSVGSESTCGSEALKELGPSFRDDNNDAESSFLSRVRSVGTKKERMWVFLLMFTTQLVANFDSGALASVYGVKPLGPRVLCSPVVNGTAWKCPSKESDGSTYPPTRDHPDVDAFVTLIGESPFLGADAVWECSQQPSQAVCNLTFNSTLSIAWQCSREPNSYVESVVTAGYKCDFVESDELTKSLLHDPNFDELYREKKLQGLLSSIVYLGLALGAVLTGIGFCYFPMQRLVQVSLVLNAVFAAWFAASTNRAMLFTSRILVGVTQATMLVYAPIWIDEFAPRQYMSTWLALIQAAAPLGIVIGYMAAGVLAAKTSLSWSWSFYFQCFGLAICVIAQLCLPARLVNVQHTDSIALDDDDRLSAAHSAKDIDNENMLGTNGRGNDQEGGKGSPPPSIVCSSPAMVREGTECNSEGRVSDAFSESASFSDQSNDRVESLRDVLKNPVIWAAVLTLSSIYFVVTAMQLWITDYLTTEPLPIEIPGETADDRYNTVVMSFGVAAITGPIAGIILGGYVLDHPKIVGGYVDNPNKAAFFCLIGGMVGAGFALGSLAVETFWPFIACIWMLLFSGAAVLPGLTGLTVSLAPYHLRGMTSAFASLMTNLLGYFSGPFAAGFVADSYGLVWGFRLGMGWSLVASCFGFWTWWAGLMKSQREGGIQEVYCESLARFFCGITRETDEVEKREEDELPILRLAAGTNGEDVLVNQAKESDVVVKLLSDACVKTLLLLSEYAEEPVPNASFGGETSVASMSLLAFHGNVANPFPMVEETYLGKKEVLYELFRMFDVNLNGSVDEEGIATFLRDNKPMARKLRHVPGVTSDKVTEAATQLFSLVQPDGSDGSRSVSWQQFADNGQDLLRFVETWRLSHLPEQYVLAGFGLGTTRHIVLQRDQKEGMPYYWGPAPEGRQTLDAARRAAQVYLFSKMVIGPSIRKLVRVPSTVPGFRQSDTTGYSQHVRCWMIGTVEDFVLGYKGFISASDTNKYHFLRSPHRQTDWRFAHNMFSDKKWSLTLRVVLPEVWKEEVAVLTRQPIVGPAGMASLFSPPTRGLPAQPVLGPGAGMWSLFSPRIRGLHPRLDRHSSRMLSQSLGQSMSRLHSLGPRVSTLASPRAQADGQLTPVQLLRTLRQQLPDSLPAEKAVIQSGNQGVFTRRLSVTPALATFASTNTSPMNDRSANPSAGGWSNSWLGSSSFQASDLARDRDTKSSLSASMTLRRRDIRRMSTTLPSQPPRDVSGGTALDDTVIPHRRNGRKVSFADPQAMLSSSSYLSSYGQQHPPLEHPQPLAPVPSVSSTSPTLSAAAPS